MSSRKIWRLRDLEGDSFNNAVINVEEFPRSLRSVDRESIIKTVMRPSQTPNSSVMTTLWVLSGTYLATVMLPVIKLQARKLQVVIQVFWSMRITGIRLNCMTKTILLICPSYLISSSHPTNHQKMGPLSHPENTTWMQAIRSFQTQWANKRHSPLPLHLVPTLPSCPFKQFIRSKY